MDSRKKSLIYFQQQRDPLKCVDLFFNGSFSTEAQSNFLRDIIKNEDNQIYPISSSYLQKITKCLIQKIEDQSLEVIDELYEELAEAMLGPGEVYNEHWLYKKYHYMSDTIPECNGGVLLRVSRSILEGGTGCSEWEAGFLLSEFILNNPSIFKGRICLELGCGTGLTGICLSQLNNTKRIHLTDGSAETLLNCSYNLSINDIDHDLTLKSSENENKILCTVLKWGDLCEIKADIILGADIIYDFSIIPDLVNLLEHLLGGAKEKVNKNFQGDMTKCYLMQTIRSKETINVFKMECNKRGLKITDLTKTMLSTLDIKFNCMPFRNSTNFNAALYLLRKRPF